MTSTAEALSLTPSCISQQVATLEREAGVPLVEPDGRRVRLTMAGRALAQHADVILNAMQAAADEVSTLERDAGGPLRVASFPTAAVSLFPQVIQTLNERFPNHRVSLVEAEPHESIPALLRGDVDLAVVYARGVLLPPPEPIGLEYEELFVDPLFCLFPRGHRIARRGRVSILDLARERWIMDEPSSSLYGIVLELCGAAGFQPTIVANCRSSQLVTALVRAGCGIAILPGLGLIGEEKIVVRPLEPAVQRRIFGVFRRGSAGRPTIVAAFALLRETATQAMTTGRG